MGNTKLTSAEKKLMDELMADLDGAVFEDMVPSPAKKKTPFSSKNATVKGSTERAIKLSSSPLSGKTSVGQPRFGKPQSPLRVRHRAPSASPLRKELIIGRKTQTPIKPLGVSSKTNASKKLKENDAPPNLPTSKSSLPLPKTQTTRSVLAPSTNTSITKDPGKIINVLSPQSKRKADKAEAEALMEGMDDLSDWEWDDGENPDKALSGTPTQLPPRIRVSQPIAASSTRAAVMPSFPSVSSSLKTISSIPPPPEYKPDPCTRGIVEEVVQLNQGTRQFEKYLLIYVDNLTQSDSDTMHKKKPNREDADWRIVELKDSWFYTDVRAGDIVNVIGIFLPLDSSLSSADFSCPFKPVSKIAITRQKNMIILHPDLLLTSTAVSDASSCTRKALVKTLIPSPLTSPTPSLVWGNMLHEVVQRCLGEGRWDKEFMESEIDSVVRTELGLGELVRLEVGVEKAKEEVRERAIGLEGFSKRFIQVDGKPKDDAELNDPRAPRNQRALLSLTGLHDVEEDIWSPVYGLKGRIDASVQGVIEEREDKLGRSSISSWAMPFEIKTGKATMGTEHFAQTMLYTLLMRERYGVEVPSGLLYYTQSEEVIRVSSKRPELIGLINARNELAAYTMRRRFKPSSWKREPPLSQVLKSGEDATSTESFLPTAIDEEERPLSQTESCEDATDIESFLPAAIDEERSCKRCYVSDACMLYRKAVENVQDVGPEVSEMYDIKTSHLTPERSEFFKKWEALLSLEENDVIRFRKELWTMTAVQREKSGRCFANMVIDVDGYQEDRRPAVARIHRHTYRFVRLAPSDAASSPSASGSSEFTNGTGSLLNGHMSKGDAVMISIEPDLLALTRGFITELTPTYVVVGVDRAINVDGILARTRSALRSDAPSQVIFRLDRDEMSAGIGRIRHNIAKLFYADGDRKRLELVVDLRKPEFDEEPAGLVEHVASLSSGGLNANQRAAMRKVLVAKDYALVLGMPGTGKTMIIAEIIKELVKRRKTVLLTSYTHSAVDNILLKMKDVEFDILRLGNVEKVHPGVRHFSLTNKMNATSFEQLERQLCDPPVVATTCLSIDHALFSRRTFDYCIVDEASQITLPTCLGPLRLADTFVLVGDHFQLPPLVRSRDAQRGGLDVSLFRRLSEAHPDSVVDLSHQYRMNEDIMALSNKLIYGGRLRCGSKEVAEQVLVLPSKERWKNNHDSNTSCEGDQCWIDALLKESCKVAFVDTDDVPARDSRAGNLVQNETEAKLVHQFSEALLDSGVDPSQIGIISLYRQQIKLLSHLFQATQAQQSIEMLTADRSQGRDKDCILISMVRSSDSGGIGDLLKDWRRMNVTITRAKRKVVIFGSRKTLNQVELMKEFFELVEEKGWVYKLPPGAEATHVALEMATATSAVINSAPPATPNRSLSCVFPTISTPNSSASKKRRGTEEGDSASKKVKKEDGILKGRFVLQDLVNEWA